MKEIQSKSMKVKTPRSFKCCIIIQKISQERKQTSNGDLQWENVASHSEVTRNTCTFLTLSNRHLHVSCNANSHAVDFSFVLCIETWQAWGAFKLRNIVVLRTSVESRGFHKYWIIGQIVLWRYLGIKKIKSYKLMIHVSICVFSISSKY